MPVKSKICEQCGQPFVITRQREAARRFCKRVCQAAHEAIHGRPAARVGEITFTCGQCGTGFSYKPAYLTAYRKKFNKDPLYCSTKCSGAAQRAKADARHTLACSNCGKTFTRKRRPSGDTLYREQHLCSQPCRNEWRSKLYRERHGLAKISRRTKRGYIVVRFPAKDGVAAHEMLEHRWVMEQHLGRPLYQDETVHHISGDKTDNRLENLQLFATNHGPGQRVPDIIAWCISMFRRYPEFTRAAGVELKDVAPKDH
jgi:hypothetical protein